MTLETVTASDTTTYGREGPRVNIDEATRTLVAFHAARLALKVSWYRLQRLFDINTYKTVYRWKTGKAVPNNYYIGRILALILTRLAEAEGKPPDTYLNFDNAKELEQSLQKSNQRREGIGGWKLPNIKG